MPELATAETLEPLLEVAETDPRLDTRLDALDIATRLPLDRRAWSAVANAAWGALSDAEPGSAERRRALVLATRIPLLSFRRMLREMAADADNPDAGALRQALARTHDPSQARRLLEEVEQGRDEAFRLLAAMDLQETDVSPDEIPSPSENAAPDAAVWRALALARLGRFEPLDGVLEASIDDVPMFWGDPSTPHGRLSAMRPVPTPMRRHLLDVHSEGRTSEVGRRIVWAVTGIADPEGTPLQEHEEPPIEPEAEGAADAPERVAAARAATERVLGSLREGTAPAPEDLDTLHRLPPDEAARFVPALITAADRMTEPLPPDDPRRLLLGNQIVEIVGRLRATEAWPVAELLDLRPRTDVLDRGQMAWVVARAPMADVVAAMASQVPVTAAAEEAGREGPGWLTTVADALADRAGSPWRGAGPEASDVIAPATLIDDAPEMARMAPEPGPPEEPAVAEQRRVHAQIRHAERRRATFLGGADNVVRTWIALPDPDAGAVADQTIPDLDLPAEGIILDAVLRWKDQTDHGTLHLPGDRTARSSECDLHVEVPDDERFVSAEIAFLYRGRAFEVVQVEAFVLPPGAEEQPHHTVEVKVRLAQREVVELPDSRVVDAVMVYGEDRTHLESPDDEAPTGLQTYTTSGGASFGLRDPDAVIDYLNTELFVAGTSLVRRRARQGETDEVLDTEDPDVLRILRTLARHGAALYNSLGEDFEDPGRRIQLRNQTPRAYSPVEFVYDRGFPTDDATICAEGLAALESDADDCPHCPSAADLPADLRIANPVICPFGFWSLQKIIERRDAAPGELDDTVGPSFPLPDRRHLPPIDSVLFASSDRVPAEERQRTWQDLEALLPDAEQAPSWTRWRQALESQLPSVLLALPHHGVEDGLDYLEIGDEALPKGERVLFRSQLIEPFVNPDRREPGPIVLLLGCRTDAPTDLGYVGLARRFQQLPVSIVLGTLAKVLGRHAAPVAREIVAQLVSVDDARADFGTIMRRVRRRMLARGYLMALCLVALGDAEWRLTPRS
jgi:hypothetical protein